MPFALLIMMQAQEGAGVQSGSNTLPPFFAPVVLGLLAAGALSWLVAAVLGFSRARAFGPSVRWFALASACLLIYHLQWIIAAFGLIQNDVQLALGVVSFFNVFVFVAGVCAVMGFVILTNPLP